MPEVENGGFGQQGTKCSCVVIWIDWYPYHVARFRGLQEAFGFDGEVAGVEMVGGIGVHAGLRFREPLPAELPINTLMPASDWMQAVKVTLSFKLWRKLNELDPELVLVPGYYTLPAITAAIWARSHGHESILMTESTADDHVRTSWKERVKSVLIRGLFSKAVAGGAAHVRYLKQLGFRGDRIGGCYDVVGNSEIEARTSLLRERSSARAHSLPQKFFLYVGRLAPEKNAGGLVQAWVQYRIEGGTWDLVIAGDGPEGPALKAQAEQSGLQDAVLFAGHKNSGELAPLYAFASCFVLPSVREPWGLVVNEAMAAGLPVIVSSRCGCIEELVEHGRNGFIFEPHQPATLTRALHTMEQQSTAALEAMGSRSCQRIADFSPAGFGRSVAALASRAPKGRVQTLPGRTI